MTDHKWVCNTPTCPGYRDTVPSEDSQTCFLCHKPLVAVVTNEVVPLSLMSRYLGQEVNVILHDGTSLWRCLTAIKTGAIELRNLEGDPHAPLHKWIEQTDIRSFGTREEGILYEVTDKE